MKKIILIDDDPTTHSIVKNVTRDEFTIVSCYSIAEADSALNDPEIPALVLIDRVLPDGDGISICTKMRNEQRFSVIPIVILSGKTTESDKVSGLFAGADDYISKPFSPLELKARIQARLRNQMKVLRVGRLSIQVESYRAFHETPEGQVELELTRIEYKLLLVLSQSFERIFSRNVILDCVWGIDSNVSDRVIDTHISNLRKKIQGTGVIVEAVRGEGYRMCRPKKDSQAA